MNQPAPDAKSGRRVALVGAGYIADYHARAVRALGDVELVGICDLSGSRAERFAAAHGIEGGAFTDLGRMLAERRPDAVHVLTPPNLHTEPCTQALEAGADVLVEKPMCHTVANCEALAATARTQGRALGVSHNFLFFPAYERLMADLQAGRFGELDQVDIVWNKELGQLRGGPFGAWMLADPRNILFEVAPHCFAHAVHLVGSPDDVQVRALDPFTLPTGAIFYRRWEILAWVGVTTVRIRLSFVPGYPEHYVHVRGWSGAGHVDFEKNTYVREEHTPHLLDIDRFANVSASARDSVLQATGTLASFVLAKAGLQKIGGPFDVSIARAVECFHRGAGGAVDERLSAALAQGAVALGERVAAQVDVPEVVAKPRTNGKSAHPPKRDPSVLVIGGTGFIGQALVATLAEAGHGVRVMSRNPGNLPDALVQAGVHAVRGDFTDDAAVAAALPGITKVIHLARGFGNTWPEYLEGDVQPTERLAHRCLDAGIERFVYASSIAIYDAGRPGVSITEDTAPVPSMLRANPYARSKVENERILLELHRTRGLPVVIVRPGIVLGSGGNPLHWGIAAWPYETVCRLYGDGNSPLPIVLVQDVADAFVRALEAPGAVGQAYNLAGPPCITANDYLDEVERRARIRLRRVPTPSLRAYTEAMVKWAIKSMGGSDALRPSFSDWRGRTFASPFDCTKARRELEWSPTESRDAMVARGIHEPVDEFFR
jgi:nucleoside-diphosphate-sugar epimerase/predicted dehydrogenase